MGVKVQVKPDFDALPLPPSNRIFHTGSVTILTDDEFESLPVAALRALTVLDGNLPDPVRDFPSLIPAVHALQTTVSELNDLVSDLVQTVNAKTEVVLLTAGQDPPDEPGDNVLYLRPAS